MIKVLDILADSIYIKNKNSEFILNNKTHRKLLGISELKDVVGKTDFDFFQPKDAELYYSKEQEIMKTRKAQLNYEREMQYKSEKSIRWMSDSKVPLKDSKGNIIGIVGIARDITEKKKAEKVLIKNIHKLQAVLNVSPDAIFMKNKDLEFILNNKAHLKLLGVSDQQQTIGKTDFDFFPKELLEKEKILSDEQKIIKTGKPLLNHEREIFLKSGLGKRWVSDSKVPLKDSEGNIIGLVGVARDITEKKLLERKIKNLSFHDDLTGLYNSRYFNQELKRLNTSRQIPLSIVVADIDGLKMVNDKFGHKEGDKLIISASKILKKSFRREDIVARWGGDEFIVLLPGTDTAKVKEIVKRNRNSFKNNKISNKITVNISLGFATKTSVKENIDTIIELADKNMYQDKM